MHARAYRDDRARIFGASHKLYTQEFFDFDAIRD